MLKRFRRLFNIRLFFARFVFKESVTINKPQRASRARRVEKEIRIRTTRIGIRVSRLASPPTTGDIRIVKTIDNTNIDTSIKIAVLRILTFKRDEASNARE